MNLKILLWSLIGIWILPTHAQKISGVVVDNATNTPLAYASVKVLSSTQGTLTDLQGKFSLDISSQADSLEISILGYVSQTVAIQPQLDIFMIPSFTTLNEVVLSASRMAQDRRDVPAAIATIPLKQLQETQAIRLDQILNQQTGVYMVHLGNESHGLSIRSPLSYGPRFLFLQDGLPILPTGNFSHVALKEMNLTAARSLEIQRGPNSAIQGSEAIGGSVNLLTKNPPKEFGARLALQGNDIGYRRVDYEAGNTFGNFGIYAGGYYMENRNGWRDFSDFEKFIITVKPVWWVSDRTKLSATVDIMDFRTDFNGGLDSTGFYGQEYSTLQTFTFSETDLVRVNTAAEQYWNNKSKTQFNVQYLNKSGGFVPFWAFTFGPDPLASTNVINSDELERTAFLLQHNQKIDFLNSEFFLGTSLDLSTEDSQAEFINVRRNELGQYVSFTNPDSLLEDYQVDYTNYAAYAKWVFSPIKNLRVTVAGRYDYFEYRYESTPELTLIGNITSKNNTFQNFAPKIGLTYNWPKGIGVYANYSRGFVPPQISSLYAFNGNNDLDPELFDSYEIGGWASFAKGNGSVEMSIYRMEGKDEIIQVPNPDGTVNFSNAGETLHEGIELSVAYRINSQWEARVNGTVARHEYVDFISGDENLSGKTIPQSPPVIANTAVTYRPKFIPNFRISAEWQHLAEYYMNNANDRKYPGFDIFHIRAGYQWNGLELWVNAMNITDKRYATFAELLPWGHNYRPGNPRHFQVGIGYRMGKI